MPTNLTPHRSARSLSRGLAGAALALSLTLTVAACGNDASSTSSAGSTSSSPSPSVASSADHNAADVSFASEMLVHHAQALEMVDLTQGRDLDPQVQALADDIRAAQAPEITTFTSWLTAWGQDVPDTSESHDSSMSSMPGMMSSEDMAALEEASDADFREMWLTMMVEHHEGAVEMAKTEVGDGEYQPAIDLAKQIATSQTKEIDTMERLLS